jgi:hypothetical protein
MAVLRASPQSSAHAGEGVGPQRRDVVFLGVAAVGRAVASIVQAEVKLTTEKPVSSTSKLSLMSAWCPPAAPAPD